jgi:hypothetical protein
MIEQVADSQTKMSEDQIKRLVNTVVALAADTSH